MELDLGAVRAFVAIADDGFFGDAADRLGVSQQAVSKRIGKLEADLGTALFSRSRHGTTLTEDGRTFLSHARTLLDLADRSVEVVRARRRPLRIDVLGSRSAPAEIVRRFHESAGDLPVDLAFSHRGMPHAVPTLVDGTVDAAFARPVGPLNTDLLRTPACLDPAHLVVSRRHPLAGRRRVRMTELAGTTVWVPGAVDPETEWADYYRAFEPAFDINIDTTGPNFGFDHYVETIASSPDRCGLVGQGSRVPWNPDVVQIPLIDPVPAYPWAVIWHSQNRHPDLATFIAYVRKSYRYSEDNWIPEADREFFSG